MFTPTFPTWDAPAGAAQGERGPDFVDQATWDAAAAARPDLAVTVAQNVDHAIVDQTFQHQLHNSTMSEFSSIATHRRAALLAALLHLDEHAAPQPETVTPQAIDAATVAAFKLVEQAPTPALTFSADESVTRLSSLMISDVVKRVVEHANGIDGSEMSDHVTSYLIAHTLLTPQQVAAVIGTTEPILSSWRARGAGPAYVTAARTVRYPYASVLEWIRGLS